MPHTVYTTAIVQAPLAPPVADTARSWPLTCVMPTTLAIYTQSPLLKGARRWAGLA